MKRLLQNLIAVAAIAIPAMVLTGALTKPIWSQVCPDCVTIKGTTSSGLRIPVAVDASGVMQTNANSSSIFSVSGINAINGAWPTTYSGVQTVGISGVSPSAGALPTTFSGTQPVYWPGTTATFSSVNVTNSATVALTGSNANRKGLIIQNNSTLYNIYIGTASPVTATSGVTLYPGWSYARSGGVPTAAWYALGTSSVAATTQVEEDQ